VHPSIGELAKGLGDDLFCEGRLFHEEAFFYVWGAPSWGGWGKFRPRPHPDFSQQAGRMDGRIGAADCQKTQLILSYLRPGLRFGRSEFS
jgi:hypothetical protein